VVKRGQILSWAEVQNISHPKEIIGSGRVLSSQDRRSPLNGFWRFSGYLLFSVNLTDYSSPIFSTRSRGVVSFVSTALENIIRKSRGAPGQQVRQGHGGTVG
jgi:hypothetical protein